MSDFYAIFCQLVRVDGRVDVYKFFRSHNLLFIQIEAPLASQISVISLPRIEAALELWPPPDFLVSAISRGFYSSKYGMY